MTKAERRISDFSSGMKKLNDKNLRYIRKLTQVLFTVEHPLVYSGAGKKAVYMRQDKFKRRSI